MARLNGWMEWLDGMTGWNGWMEWLYGMTGCNSLGRSENSKNDEDGEKG